MYFNLLQPVFELKKSVIQLVWLVSVLDTNELIILYLNDIFQAV